MRRARPALGLVAAMLFQACAGPAPTPWTPPSTVLAPTPAPSAARIVHIAEAPSVAGEPIALRDLSGRIVTDDFEDVFAFDVDGSDFVRIADAPGPEFDAAWSPDGAFVVYRDSTRGINVDDEVFVARADGTRRRNLSHDPGNDWGPDWSPDGSTIAFNSDREGSIRGYLVDPEGANLRRIDVDAWLEYPAWSPDGTQLAFMGATGATYELFVVDLATNDVRQLTDTPGSDGWPAWSPDGSTIAFASERDDCRYAPPDAECWRDDGGRAEHHSIWTIRPDGTGLRRVSPEHAQFVAWSPDGEYLLLSGYALFVVRPDGTGRLEVRTPSLPRALGGIPDWTG
jgi:Tol biopolymer transport system component